MAKNPSDLLEEHGLDENRSAEENLDSFVDPNDILDEAEEDAGHAVEGFDPDAFIADEPDFDPDKFIAENPSPEDATPEKVSLGQSALAGLMGFGRSASLGLADRAGAAMEAITPSPSADVDKALIEQGFTITQPANTYEANLQRRKNLEAEQAAQSPIASTIGDIAGYVVPGVGAEKLVAKGLAKIAPSVSRLATAAPKVAERAGVAGKALMARMAQGGLSGGLFGAGANVIEGHPEDAGMAGTIGTTIGASIPLVGAAFRAVPKLLKKGASFFGGASQKAQQEYLVNPEFIKTVKTPEQLKRSIDESMAKIKADFDAGKIAQDEAEKAIKASRELAKETLKQNEAAKKFDVDKAFDTAKSTLNEAFDAQAQAMKDVPPPTHVVDTVHDSIEALQKKVIEESKKAAAILEKSPVTIERSDILGYLEPEIKQLTDSFSKNKIGAAKELQAWYDRFVQKLPLQVSAAQAKKIIQDIDLDTVWTRTPGEFDEIRNRVLKGLRRAIDAPLKDPVKGVPGYAEAMATKVAPLSTLLDEATEAFGTTRKAQSKLFKIDNPLLQNEQRILQDLGLQTDQNFVKDLTEYLVTKKTYTNNVAMKQLKKSLPEYKQFSEAESAAEALAQPHGEATPLGTQYLKEAAAVKGTSSEAERLKALYDKFKKLSEASSEGKIKNVLQDRDMFSRDLMKDFSKETGKDLVGEIDKLNLASEIDPKLLNPEAGLGAIPHMSTSSLKTTAMKQALAPATKMLLDAERAAAKSPKFQSTLKALPTLHKQLGYALTSPIKDKSEAPIPQETKEPQNPRLAEKKDRGYLDDITDADIDAMKSAIPNEDKPQHNALRNILENAKGRDVKGRAALLFSLKQNPVYRPFIEQYIKERGTANER